MLTLHLSYDLGHRKSCKKFLSKVPEDRPYPDRREGCQRPKSGLNPLPLGRHTSTRKTHGLPPPPVTNPTTERKATGTEGLRPARLSTRGPGSSARTRILKGRKGPRCPQPSTSFPPLPHPRPRLEPPPREPETRGPQFTTPAPDLALNRVSPAPNDHPAAFLLGVLGLYLRQNSRPRSTMASAQLPDPAQNQPPPLNAPPFSSPRLRGLPRVLARLVELRGPESCGRARRTPPRGGALTAATVEGLPPGRQRGATATFIVRERREREALLVDVTWFMKPSPRSEAAEQTLRRIISCFNLLLDRN
ncbi:hypothetical protein R6Z07F_002929 [Ovis aries]